MHLQNPVLSNYFPTFCIICAPEVISVSCIGGMEALRSAAQLFPALSIVTSCWSLAMSQSGSVSTTKVGRCYKSRFNLFCWLSRPLVVNQSQVCPSHAHHLAKSGEIFGSYNWEAWVLLVSRGKRQGDVKHPIVYRTASRHKELSSPK